MNLPAPCDHERTWDWKNLIWACDPCQRRKLNRSPIDQNGNLMINPRQDEPLLHLRIDLTTGRLVSVMNNERRDARGEHTINVLRLDQRPDLDEDRLKKFEIIRDYITEIVEPDAPQRSINLCWTNLRRELEANKPFLMVAQQLFTTPPPEFEPLVDKLYEVVPEAREVLAPFRLQL